MIHKAHALHPAMANWLTIDPATESSIDEIAAMSQDQRSGSAEEMHPVWNGTMARTEGPEQMIAQPRATVGSPLNGHAALAASGGQISFRGEHYANPPSTDIGQPRTLSEICVAAQNLAEPVKQWMAAAQAGKDQASRNGDFGGAGMAPQEYQCVGETLGRTCQNLKLMADQCMELARQDPANKEQIQGVLDYVSEQGWYCVNGLKAFNGLAAGDMNADSYRKQLNNWTVQSINMANMSFMSSQEYRQNADQYAMESEGRRGGMCGGAGAFGNPLMNGNMYNNPMMYNQMGFGGVGGPWGGAINPAIMGGVGATQPPPQQAQAPTAGNDGTADAMFGGYKLKT